MSDQAVQRGGQGLVAGRLVPVAHLDLQTTHQIRPLVGIVRPEPLLDVADGSGQFADAAAQSVVLGPHQMAVHLQSADGVGNLIRRPAELCGKLVDEMPILVDAKIDPPHLQIFQTVEHPEVVVGQRLVRRRSRFGGLIRRRCQCDPQGLSLFRGERSALDGSVPLQRFQGRSKTVFAVGAKPVKPVADPLVESTVPPGPSPDDRLFHARDQGSPIDLEQTPLGVKRFDAPERARSALALGQFDGAVTL